MLKIVYMRKDVSPIYFNKLSKIKKAKLEYLPPTPRLGNCVSVYIEIPQNSMLKWLTKASSIEKVCIDE